MVDVKDGKIVRIRPFHYDWKFKRITWDEAATIVAGEIRRIHKKYGHNAILMQGTATGSA